MLPSDSGVSIRAFRAGDGPALARVWTASAPGDPMTYPRFVEQVLLDRNFDPAGLRVAEREGRILGAAYAVRRRVAADGADLESDIGWIPFFFVDPACRRRGIGRALLEAAMGWLRDQGRERVTFSSYTPNYILPGLDAARYPEAARLLASLGFTTDYEAVAMNRSLGDYAMPGQVRQKIAALREAGYRFDSPTSDELVDLIEIAGAEFNPDWARGIREAVLGGLGLEKIIVGWDPAGAMLGWAMFGTYERVIDRFGPFGVLPSSRGLGLGEALLHLTLERMRGAGAHGAWFLWTDDSSPAGRLYLKTGFTITRTFAVMSAPLIG